MHIDNVFTAEGNTNVKRRTQYSVPGGYLPSTNVSRPPKIGFQNCLVEEGEGRLNNFRVRNLGTDKLDI